MPHYLIEEQGTHQRDTMHLCSLCKISYVYQLVLKELVRLGNHIKRVATIE